MGSIKVTNHLDDLTRDMAAIGPAASRRLVTAVRDNANEGARLARTFARETAGAHGKHYPRSITVDSTGKVAGSTYSAEYGPDPARKQGGMSFEWGSRNQPPHLDLNKSADIVGPQLESDVRAVLNDLFWGAEA